MEIRENMAVLFMLIETVSKIATDEHHSDDQDDCPNLTTLACVVAATGATISSTLRDEKPIRINRYLELTIPNLNKNQFQQHFRISRDAYESLLKVVGPLLKRRSEVGRATVDVERQLLATIWLLATHDSYRSVGERFDLAKSSLSASFVRLIKVLNRICRNMIKWPTREEQVTIEQAFYQMGRLPGVIGAVDGTLVPMKAPTVDPEVYITRKCNFAITLQAICDHSLRFTDIFVGYPGSISDVRIFRNSDIYRSVQEHQDQYFPGNTYIIGDKAYPTLPWCIEPYINRERLTLVQQHFNKALSKTRQTIERSFALLFGRFRRLKFLDMNRTDLIPATVLAACVLHNVCLNSADLLVEEYIQLGGDGILNNDVVNGYNVMNNYDDNIQLQQGLRRRDQLAEMIYIN